MSPSVDTIAELLWLMNEQLVLEAQPVDWGFDLTLNQARLAVSPEERVRLGIAHSRRVMQIRGGCESCPRFDPHPILEVLVRYGVDFVVIGGLAGIAHGSAYNTLDVAVAHERSPANLERLAAALTELGATLHGALEGLPFQPDAETLRAGSNFTFETRYGPLDVLGDPVGLRDTEPYVTPGRPRSFGGLLSTSPRSII